MPFSSPLINSLALLASNFTCFPAPLPQYALGSVKQTVAKWTPPAPLPRWQAPHCQTSITKDFPEEEDGHSCYSQESPLLSLLVSHGLVCPGIPDASRADSGGGAGLKKPAVSCFLAAV